MINDEIIESFLDCKYKAYRKINYEHGVKTEFELLQEDRLSACKTKFYNRLLEKYGENNVLKGYNFGKNRRVPRADVIIQPTLCTETYQISFDAIEIVTNKISSSKKLLIPVVVTPNETISKIEKLSICIKCIILSQSSGMDFEFGKIVYGSDMKILKFKIKPLLAEAKRMLNELTRIAKGESKLIIFQKNHCKICEFQEICEKELVEKDSLGLLHRMGEKDIKKYNNKGIFTTTQLSYSFKPRRKRKRTKKTNSHFNLELQALAIRTEKIYIQELPDIPRHHLELFLDIEGIPDKNFYYLIGLLVCEGEKCFYYSFWANTAKDEEHIWQEFLKKINDYPEAPVYHYGKYESRAVDTLVKKYSKNGSFKNRLINVNSYVYSKVYFPVRSNSLKDLGKFIGASWTSPDASGLQSLVWRYCWEENKINNYKQLLTTYNEEDCRALQLLTEYITKIRKSADLQENIDFADKPKQNTTERGSEIHRELEYILRTSYADYQRNRIGIRSKESIGIVERKKPGPPKGHPGYTRLIPSKAGKVIRVPMRQKCSKQWHKDDHLQKTEKMAEKTIIDLHFIKNGCRKIITKYVGRKGYCERCRIYYNPHKIAKLGPHMFGHGFQAWTIYQRVILRLPYRIITQSTEDLFGERMSTGTIVGFIRHFSQYYTNTERILVQHIFKSPFVHVDETRINIEGTEQYVWVFTDGEHVVFRLTETRETTVVHEFLSDYKGVLISDFYPGYDSIKCSQQKCWVHLIRDLNDDLWKSPFNTEFESFVFEVKNMITPILETVEKYRSKRRHLNKFKKSVEQFYKTNIIDRDYKSEITRKYQKRFKRYKESLFTFLDQDFIPWNNNAAERAIRHLAVQRKISGRFFEQLTHKYLLLLGIAQTCKFQDKSFLKFLISKEKDVDKFKTPKRLKISKPVVNSRNKKKNGRAVDLIACKTRV